MSSNSVVLAVGSHTWTPDNTTELDKLLNVMRKHKISIIDTARSYGLGASETVLGLKKLANEDTPVEQQMEAIQTLYKQETFEAFGVSNFTPEQVIEFYNYAKSKGYVLPTIYQSSYSLAVRQNETRLFPTLRKLGISIQAYSPMAGGLLSKTPEYIEQGKGNWDPNTPSGKIFRDLYYKPSYLKMLEEFGKLSEESGVSRSGLAYRWVRYHSALKAELGDEMILGSVTAQQLEEAVTELDKGPLDAALVEKLESLWQLIKDDAPIDNLISVRKVVRGFA
ncbi:aflatoxin b1 aldehyde reductase member 3 [Trichoderma arundinaceum]|uniref:Aflatoxin b1 aldehyde reductase member 3 n=1 Tax=Trichoderma arundinaceum TaxID=490622 RepID=A0A395P0D9_TRIAR|nr:aflatoxin b1 aldehyde reductase member 3 [Trichoderma arundinaceum]